jgi:hypothetical protein
MAARASIRGLIAEFLESRQPERIGPAEWDALLAFVAKEIGDARRVRPRYVLDVLHEGPTEVDRSLGGLPVDLRGRVHTGDAEAAAASLLAMSGEYGLAGDAVRAEDVRRAVRQAKDRLRLTLQRKNLKQDTRVGKQELLGWFLVWLENPLVFPAWLEVRRKVLS